MLVKGQKDVSPPEGTLAIATKMVGGLPLAPHLYSDNLAVASTTVRKGFVNKVIHHSIVCRTEH